MPELVATVIRAPRSKAIPVTSQRKSLRSEGHSDGPVLDRAIKLTKERKGTGTPSIDSFTILQSVSDEHLLEVAKDSCIVFPTAAGPPVEILSVFRAAELAQAELALAREKAEKQAIEEKERDTTDNNPDPAKERTVGMETSPTQSSAKGAKIGPIRRR